MGCVRISCDKKRSSPLNEDRQVLVQDLCINNVTSILSQEMRSTAT